MLIPHKGHTDTIQVYSVTVMTHVKALQAGHSSQGTSEPITPGQFLVVNMLKGLTGNSTRRISSRLVNNSVLIYLFKRNLSCKTTYISWWIHTTHRYILLQLYLVVRIIHSITWTWNNIGQTDAGPWYPWLSFVWCRALWIIDERVTKYQKWIHFPDIMQTKSFKKLCFTCKLLDTCSIIILWTLELFVLKSGFTYSVSLPKVFLIYFDKIIHAMKPANFDILPVCVNPVAA